MKDLEEPERFLRPGKDIKDTQHGLNWYCWECSIMRGPIYIAEGLYMWIEITAQKVERLRSALKKEMAFEATIDSGICAATKFARACHWKHTAIFFKEQIKENLFNSWSSWEPLNMMTIPIQYGTA